LHGGERQGGLASPNWRKDHGAVILVKKISGFFLVFT
jgi:hypothetical protein